MNKFADRHRVLGNTAGSSNPGGYNLHYLENNLGMNTISAPSDVDTHDRYP